MSEVAASRNYRSPADRRAFTLIETILVLAVITLLGALLLPGVNSILRTINQEEPDRLFHDTIVRARELALTTNRTVTLRVADDGKTLVWADTRQVLPPGARINLLQSKPGNAILLGGSLVETEELPAVRFYADGTCDRFRAQIIREKGAPQFLLIDPWTCAPVLGLDR